MHEIHLKRVYEAAEPGDGVRVLVDRLWPRGIRKADLPYDVWAKEVTPSSELRTLYHRGEMPFAGFREGYAEELEASEGAAAFAERCREWLKTQNVTALCREEPAGEPRTRPRRLAAPEDRLNKTEKLSIEVR